MSAAQLEMEENDRFCNTPRDSHGDTDNTTAAGTSRTSSMTRTKVKDELENSRSNYIDDDYVIGGRLMAAAAANTTGGASSPRATDLAAAAAPNDFASTTDSSINLQEIYENFVQQSSTDQSLNAAVIAALTLCLDQTASSDEKDARASVKTDVARSKLPRKIKKLKSLFPYKRLEDKSVAYRGFPIDGPPALYNSEGWKVQITGASLGPPTEPMPQFPQQEVLYRSTKKTYCGAPKVKLTDDQVAWNSGQMYLGQEGFPHVPTSRSFYTSGYVPGSAVEIMKPFAESIYDTVINNSPLDVQLCSSPYNKTTDS